VIFSVGVKFNKFTIIASVKQKQWLCRCECGIQKTYHECVLKKRLPKSCGSYLCVWGDISRDRKVESVMRLISYDARYFNAERVSHLTKEIKIK
jgi:hypothetical protein